MALSMEHLPVFHRSPDGNIHGLSACILQKSLWHYPWNICLHLMVYRWQYPWNDRLYLLDVLKALSMELLPVLNGYRNGIIHRTIACIEWTSRGQLPWNMCLFFWIFLMALSRE